jgi:hypothetical protein
VRPRAPDLPLSERPRQVMRVSATLRKVPDDLDMTLGGQGLGCLKLGRHATSVQLSKAHQVSSS